MIEFFLLSLIKFLGWIIRLMPVRVALSFGKALGTLGYYFSFKARTTVYSNLRMAFADSKSPQELKEITKKVFQNYAQNFMEFLRMSTQDVETLKKFIHFEGEEYVKESILKGNGTILLSMHFGCWEMASVSTALLNHPYKVMVRAQKKYSTLEALLNSYRSFGGSAVVSRGMGTRDLIKALKNNEMVGIVVDQGGKDGVNIPFFGRSASFADGAVRLALKKDIPICFSVIIREDGPQQKVFFTKPLELIRTGNFDEDVKSNLIKIAQMMEVYIRTYPADYMWFYKVWKYSHQANIAIFDDGRTGHLRQSEAVAVMIQKALAERGKESSSEIVKICFKSTFYRGLFSSLGIFPFLKMFNARVGFLRHFLTRESYEQLRKIKADFVISCGSTTPGVNRFYSLDARAKSVHILRPGLWGYGAFDFIFLPHHDYSPRLKRFKNITRTFAAPNLINDEYLEAQKNAFLNRFPALKNNGNLKIGLLLGGDAKDVYLSDEQIKSLIFQIKDVCSDKKADVIVTTSRRTPVKMEEFICNELKDKDYCPAFILANERNIPEAVGGILSLCNLIIVSGDSISMVSEAASSGKNVIVFPAMIKEGASKTTQKHQQFINILNDEGLVIFSDVKNISKNILDVMNGKLMTKKLNDQDIIFETARRII